MAYADRQQAQQHFSVLWPVSLLVQSTCVGCHMSSSFQNSRSAMPIPNRSDIFLPHLPDTKLAVYFQQLLYTATVLEKTTTLV